jgi:RNA polymerase sigma-54 factor
MQSRRRRWRAGDETVARKKTEQKSMALNLQQVQKQTQRLIMTPQMQQSIQLLQLNAIELEQLAEMELLENPFLTVNEDAPEGEEERQVQNKADENGSKDAPTETDTEAAGEDAPTGESLEAAPEHFEDVDLNWDDYYTMSSNPSYSGNGRESGEEERDFSEYTPSRTSLYEHLSWQLRTCVLDGVDAEIGEYLLGSIDEDGYLTTEAPAEAVEQFHVPKERVMRVLKIVQEFEPVGVGAQTLAECLLIQLKQLGMWNELTERVLNEHMEMFQRKKFREIGRALGVGEQDIVDVYNRVARLEPYPGRSISAESVQYIKPDVFVKLIDGELMIFLNEGQTGRLSVDRFYRRLIRQQAKALTREEKDYALDKYRSALALIKNIEKRKSTILRVTEAIMEVQRPFLEKGVSALKPLTLREVADMVGMHESTVARVTSRKYVETPQGTFSLKYFFSSSIESEGNDAVSSRAIKDRIQQIIEEESPKKPYSDQKIADMLKTESFDIARRTVAKYREQMKILPAKFRRAT